jgi:hypothetical protein
MPLDMSKKQWPDQRERRRSWGQFDWTTWRRFSDGIFVGKGSMVCKELSFKGILKPIPAGECAITSLVRGGNYYIYGATSGKQAHLFRYRPRGANGVLADMNVIGTETEVRNSLVVTKDNLIVGGTRSDQPGYAGGWIFTAQASVHHGDFIQEWGMRESPIKLALRPFKGEGFVRMVYDPVHDLIYGLTDKSGTLFLYDAKKNKVKKIGLVDERGFSTALVVDPQGTLYGAGFEGHIFRYTPGMAKPEFTGTVMPTFSGRNVFDQVDSLVYDAASGLLYGGGREFGTLFSFNPATGEAKFLGQPTINHRLRSIAAGNDGRIYGIAGDSGDMAHLFVYDPRRACLQDLGMPLATMEMRWYGYVFDTMLTGEDGELYLGQSERVSMLFIYYPDIQKPQLPKA